jgi:hypothetical protein
MKHNIIVAAGLCALLYSCKKDDDTGTPPVVTSNPLSSVLVKYPGTNDSAKFNLTYSNNRLTGINLVSNKNGVAGTTAYSITRNSSGVITGVNAGDGSSSIGYNSTTGQYTYSLQPHAGYTDSTAFTYTGNNITEAVTYRLGSGGSGYTPLMRSVYTYNTSNSVTQVQTYNYVGTTWVPLATYAYTFDTYSNPLRLNSEALILAGASTLGTENLTFMGLNNISGITYQDLINPTNNYNTTYSYTYNTSGMPISATGTSSTGTTSTISYAY